MNEEAESRIAAQPAKAMAMLCVWNSRLENTHAGIVPVTKTGDWSEVAVLDSGGHRIPWCDVSRIDDEEMRSLMRDAANRLYTFQARSTTSRMTSRAPSAVPTLPSRNCAAVISG
ncbi:hypothetical protein LAZ29_02425 [Cereibacter sphaeroides]|uniref:hypothetical protein n=1 Tax=Cereibacter sphaeroides TaxID=1063 RepID=UPI001F29234F|nr:hypothetical protein [Cereibacter sphaeroides]MCE6949778.1 hypothetical protein [Cereibacter sphaeroides]